MKIEGINSTLVSYKNLIQEPSISLDRYLKFVLPINSSIPKSQNIHKFISGAFYQNFNYFIENIPIVENEELVVCGYKEFFPEIHKFVFHYQYCDKINMINLGYNINSVN